jgi:hypothetical protein
LATGLCVRASKDLAASFCIDGEHLGIERFHQRLYLGVAQLANIVIPLSPRGGNADPP